MNCGKLPAAALAARWALILVCTLAAAQTRIDMHSQARNIDFSQATATRPFPVGPILPAVCATGETYFKSDAPAGRNLYLCTSMNMWTPIEGGGTGADTDTTYTGHHDFSGAASLQVKVQTQPAAADCDSASEAGRMVFRKADPSSGANVLYLCQSTAAGTAEWKASTYAFGTAQPQNCTVGELFFDTDAPSGHQWLGCIAPGVWESLAGAGVPSPAGAAGRLLGSNGVSPSWRSLDGFLDDGAAFVPNGTVLAELGGNNTWVGHQAYPASPVQVIAASTNKIVCNRHTVAVSAASPVTLNSTATIENGTNGQVCVIVNTGPASVVLQDQDTLPSSNLQLASATVELAPKASVRLMFHSTIGDWVQEGVGSSDVVRAPRCGAGSTSAPWAATPETLASHLFSPGELQAGDHLRISAFWEHRAGSNGTFDTPFRTRLQFGGAPLPETEMPAATDSSLFSEYWIYISGASSQTVVQRHFRTADNSFLGTVAALQLAGDVGTGRVDLQARAAGNDDAVALSAYCIEVVKGK